MYVTGRVTVFNNFFQTSRVNNRRLLSISTVRRPLPAAVGHPSLPAHNLDVQFSPAYSHFDRSLLDLNVAYRPITGNNRPVTGLVVQLDPR